MPSKRCPRCGLTYADPAAAFSRLKRATDGFQYKCKTCAGKDRSKQLRNRTPEQREADRLSSRRYYYANLDSERAKARLRRMAAYHGRKRNKARWLVTLRRMSKP